MERGISKASENELLVVQARSHVENHFQQGGGGGGGSGSPDSLDSVGFVPGAAPGAVVAMPEAQMASLSVHHVAVPPTPSPNGFVDTPVYTFTLPDLTTYPGQTIMH